MFRHLLVPAAALLLFTCACEAQAKRYILKRDPQTGRLKMIDPNESLLSKVTKPILRPVVRPIVRAKTAIFGREVQARGQIKGFGGPLTQQGMQQPTGIAPKVATVATKTLEEAGGVAAGKPGREAAGFFNQSLRKVFGEPGPRPSPAGGASQGGR